MPEIEVGGLLIVVPDNVLLPGPPGPPGEPGLPGADGSGAVARVTSCILVADSAIVTVNGVELMLGSEIIPVNVNNRLYVEAAIQAKMWRNASACVADVALQERVDVGSGWGAWVPVRTMYGFFNYSSVGPTDIRGSRSCLYDRALAGIVKCQHRLVSSGFSTSPAPEFTLYAGSALRYIEAA